MAVSLDVITWNALVVGSFLAVAAANEGSFIPPERVAPGDETLKVNTLGDDIFSSDASFFRTAVREPLRVDAGVEFATD